MDKNIYLTTIISYNGKKIENKPKISLNFTKNIKKIQGNGLRIFTPLQFYILHNLM